MDRKNLFNFSTLSQVEYFAKIGRQIALANNQKAILKINKDKAGSYLCVVVNDSYDLYSDIATATRKAWFIDNDKIQSVEYVCAVCHCTIVAVYKLQKTIESYEQGRMELNIEIADFETQRKYLGRKLNGKQDVNGAIFYM